MSSNRPERQKDQPRGHVFDGIFEYDNDLPGWWVAMFIIAIIFSVLYLGWYHLGIFPSQSLEGEYRVARYEAAAAAAAALAAAPPPADIGAVAGDKDAMAAAKETYVSTCSACHGLYGAGVIGPNLTDDFWLHGNTTAAVEVMINKGVAEKGMPGWGDALGPEKVRQLVAYIVSLQGSNPADPKAPQGEPGKLQ